MKIMKKILCTVLVVVLCLTSAPLSGFVGLELPDWNWKASADGGIFSLAESGQCGDNAYWKYNEVTGKLIISGFGSLNDEGVFLSTPITELVIEDGITSSGAFAFCPYLKTATIPEGVEIFEYGLFYYCKALSSVTIPSSVERIEEDVFGNCDSLKDVYFDGTAEQWRNIKIGGGNGSLSKAKIHISSSEILRTGFCGPGVRYTYNTATYELVINGTGPMYDYNDFEDASPFSNFYITNVIIEDGVTSIGSSAFEGVGGLINASIPNSVTSIGHYAFANCSKMSHIIIPNSVTTIGYGAFMECSSLTSITIPESVTVIKNSAFNECESLERISVDKNNTAYSNDDAGVLFDKNKTILICYPMGKKETKYTIPDSVKIIGAFAFESLYNIEDVIFGKSLTTIEEGAFSNCENLVNIKLPESVETIGNLAFSDSGLTYIDIPNSVVSIGYSAFAGCNNLEYVTIGMCLKIIGEDAFSSGNLMAFSVNEKNDHYSVDDNGVLFNKDKSILISYPAGSRMKSYVVPKVTRRIGKSAFAGSDNLNCVTVSEGVDTIEEGAFGYCDNLENVILSNSLIEIGVEAFQCCRKLKSITIPESVEYIGTGAFMECYSITFVEFSRGIIEIETSAFEYCDNLTDVYFYGTEEQWNNIDIDDYNEPLLNATIHFLGEPDCTHKETFEQTIPASCTVSGMKFTVCVDCGETIGSPEVIPAAHTPGEWEIVVEPTYEAEGKKVKKCTVCGETLEEEIIPKLELAVVEDEETGVGLEFPAENYDGKVEIEVKESFDGTAFNILDTKTGAEHKKIYDIKMLVDGEVTQPNGKVKVKLPLPAGYNPKFSFVYYVNTETKEVEKMKATYEDGYMVFETDHFSYYAIIAEPDTDNCSCNCHVGGIKKFFFKFLLFFQKIFKKNKQCKCGIYHY